MRMLTDNPIVRLDDDMFGHDNYARLISTSLTDTPDLPFCIGVFGQWGTGKTSLMRMIKEDLEESPDIKTIWFNPWKYDKQQSLWSALIQTILYKIVESQGETDLRKKALDLAKATGWLVLKQGLSRLTAGIVTAKNIDELKDSISKQDELYYRHVNHFEEDFEQVINAYSAGGRLAVFIDDLDRCLPVNAVTVLESLKLFIGNSRCVFILGMDPYVVEQGINSRYGATLKMSGRDYIDKIIQVPFFIPPVSFSRLKNCVSVAKTAEYTPQIWRILELGLDGNPRKIKRFVNCFYFLQEVVRHSAIVGEANEVHGEPHLSTYLSDAGQRFYLAKLLVLQLCFDKFYAYLQLHPDAWHKFEVELIPAASLESRDAAFKTCEGLRKFWEDERLQSFMRNTVSNSDNDFPGCPASPIVSALMKAVNLVGRSSSSSSGASSSSSFGGPSESSGQPSQGAAF